MSRHRSRRDVPRVLLLLPKESYRSEDFLHAAEILEIDVIVAGNQCHQLADHWQLDKLLSLPFDNPAKAAKMVQKVLAGSAPQAVIGIDDHGVEAAAAIAEALKLKSNSRLAVETLRDKYRFRKMQQQLGLPYPAFVPIQISNNRINQFRPFEFPAVVKPTRLSGSRGVIRVNAAEELDEAINRIDDIIRHSKMDSSDISLLVEQYLEGSEHALEAIMEEGELCTLAIFDKPDPLQGPCFAETIYVTPSCLSKGNQMEYQRQVQMICRQAGILNGPIHAEARIYHGTVTLLEVAPRSIGGLCGKVLRHALGMSLEELILRHALGEAVPAIDSSNPAVGVMMLPVHVAGIFNGIDGIDKAQAVPGIEAIEISARPGDRVLPLPEESIYLGFVFASGESPEFVVSALRAARDCLQINIKPILNVAASGG
ncbi:MAG: ATP-grasp domain-containing protein [Acidiferrobacterales bacterium]